MHDSDVINTCVYMSYKLLQAVSVFLVYLLYCIYFVHGYR